MFKSGEKNPFQLSKSVHAHTLKIIIRGREERGGQQGGGVRQTEEQRRRGGREESKWDFFFKVKKVIPRQEFKHQQKKACSSFKTSSRKRVPPLCTPVDSQEWLKFQEERVMSCRCIGEQDSHFTFRKEKKKKKRAPRVRRRVVVGFPVPFSLSPSSCWAPFSFSVGSRSSLALQKAQTGMQRRLCREYKKIGDPWEGRSRLNRSL